MSVVILVALLVCLIPTTIGALLSAIGIAGMDRLVQRNVLAMSGRAVEAAGDVQTLLLDKTGTITFGNRMASEFFPVGGHTEQERGRGRPAGLAGRRDPRGPLHRGAGQGALRHPRARHGRRPQFMPFTATTRMSGLDVDGRQIRKGAADSVKRWVAEQGGTVPDRPRPVVEQHLPAGLDPAGGGRRRRGPRASSSSRTSSSRASGRSSTRCARWASAPS